MNYALNVCPEQDRVIMELRNHLAHTQASAYSERAANEETINAMLEEIKQQQAELAALKEAEEALRELRIRTALMMRYEDTEDTDKYFEVLGNLKAALEKGSAYFAKWGER